MAETIERQGGGPVHRQTALLEKGAVIGAIKSTPSVLPQNDVEPTGELIREALDETRELVRLEVALAREEIRSDLAQAKAGGIAFGVAATAALSGITLCLVAVAAAFSILWLAALILGGIFLVFAATAGVCGWIALPKRPMNETRERLESDMKQLKERAS